MNNSDSWNVHAINGEMCITDRSSTQLAKIRKATAGSCVFVVSPIQQGSESLKELIDDAIAHDNTIWAKLEHHFQRWVEVVEELVPEKERGNLQQLVKDGFNDIEAILKAVWLVGNASASARKFFDTIELSWILKSLQYRLEKLSYSVSIVDSSDIFTGKFEGDRVTFDYEKTGRTLSDYLLENPSCNTLCIAGGWVKDEQGRLIDSVEADSELVASVCGNLLDASQITFWNRDTLVMTADPDEVPSAVVISEITYAEATELSYFGAKVLHPQAFVPAMVKKIPIVLRSFSQVDHPGTLVVASRVTDTHESVKGFSVIHDAALINIEGAGMIGIPGISSRLFTAMRENSISVILISQASSEHSICFAVPKSHAELAAATARRVFAEELEEYKINTIDIEDDCAILAAVGQQMPGIPGIAAKFFGALGKAHVNVRAIAQGSSEQNISAVIKNSDSTKALRALHAGFFLSKQTLSIGLIGPGLIGTTLLKQISLESERLKQEFNVDLRVRGIANSTKMLLDEQGIDLDNWKENFSKSAVPVDMRRYTEHIAADYFPHAVLIDCSTSSVIPSYYLSWIERGIHIITPNKKAGTAPFPEYEKLMDVGRKNGKHFLYETTVGAGLPIIGTLKDLIQTGDRIRKIEGVLSGTLGYLFWRFDGTIPFSQLVKEARALGYTEPDPRDDLTGMDIVRKAVILSREIGMNVEISQVPVLNLVPDYLMHVPLTAFMEELHIIDDHLLALQQDAERRGELLKYVGIIEPGTDTCRVELKGYAKDHPFARISGTDNIVAFTTDRYYQQPLVIQGPGAGPEVTAGGVFADLLRLGAFLGARF